MIKVLLFAHLQEEVGENEIMIQEEGMSVVQLKNWLQDHYQVSGARNVMVAINEEYANDDDKIVSGDIVAIIPPVSGG
ncbi:molybdopterin converting factor subunit 1 [Bacillus sp. 2205SS5-2]|uniref:molybdopterin converting factor subunit 1 n=1 Tax=Bacillus sp. 2205SS5-2 TaxID=3109031 RepID=UPI003004FF63